MPPPDTTIRTAAATEEGSLDGNPRPALGVRGVRACRRLADGTAVYIVGDRDPGIRLDLFLKERIPRLSRRRIQEAIGDRVEAPGHGRPRPATLLRPGDTVIVRREPPPDEPEPAIRLPLLHLDDHIVALDKPAGVLSHPSRRVTRLSVTHLLARLVEGPLHLAHRLDRETSGVMVVARSSEAARAVSRQLAREGEAAIKTYVAAVFGEMPDDRGEIDLPLGRAARSAVYIKRGVDQAGRPARTDYEVLARGRGFTLVRVRLMTGRRHQIRVHLAAIGFPVVGDKLYGRTEAHYLRYIQGGFDERMRRELLTDRQMLHSASLEMRHPGSAERVRFEAPLPPDLRAFLADEMACDPCAVRP